MQSYSSNTRINMELKIDNKLILQILSERVVSKDIPDREEVMDILVHALENNETMSRHLILMLLGIEPILSYQIGDVIHVPIEHLSSWNIDDLKKYGVDNAPDTNDCIIGTVKTIDKYAEYQYTVEFRYSYRKDPEDDIKKRNFNQQVREDWIFDRVKVKAPELDI
jgi:hypothetical protein